MQSLKINFVEMGVRVNNNSNYDNASALERFYKATIALANISVSFRQDRNNQPIAKISAIFTNKREEIVLMLNQDILDYIFSAIAGKWNKDIIDIDANKYDDFKMDAGYDFQFEVFKNEIEAGRILSFKADFVTSKGDHYLCAESFSQLGKIKYCIKRTEAVEQFLMDKNLK
ncbi:hypothetical protein [Parabacteroides faecis]|uniref:hypothetical protein n=1 Tax=Parabacteroides faecis TaxID=1217282 RepID=UPI003521EF07